MPVTGGCRLPGLLIPRFQVRVLVRAPRLEIRGGSPEVARDRKRSPRKWSTKRSNRGVGLWAKELPEPVNGVPLQARHDPGQRWRR